MGHTGPAQPGTSGGGAGDDWRPAASGEALRARAAMLARIRAFFAERGVLEVETPLLGAATTTDPAIESLAVPVAAPGAPPRMYLQSSPEHAMKRLLAAGSGPIYQITRAFRGGEAGRLHNPEFTILEWYRPGFDDRALMEEVEALVRAALVGLRALPAFRRLAYRDAFLAAAGIDPDRAGTKELAACAREAGLEPSGALAGDRRALESWLLTELVVPRLCTGGAVFVHDWPVEQAALARLKAGPDGTTAARFELFVDGLELANGYHELADAAEQHLRFERDRRRRRQAGAPVPEPDRRLIAALEAGLPDCAGVALGVDRLLMVGLGVRDIREVLTFPVERA